MPPWRLLLISGSLRSGSTNTAVLRTAAVVTPDGAAAVLYGGLAELPAFNPDEDTEQPPAPVVDLRRCIRDASAVLFSVPEYAGALPGSVKNLLDWTISDDHPGSIYRKPVAWINASPRGAAGAHAELRIVLGYAHAAIVEPACAHISITADMIGDDGVITDPAVRLRIAQALTALLTST